MQQPPPQPPAPPGPPLAPTPAYGNPQYAQPFGYAPPPRPNRRRWWIFGCGGCAALALITVAILAAIGINIFSNSPLRHFPTEAGASTVRDNLQVNNGQSSETVVIDDPHQLAAVEQYYQDALRSGGWTVDGADVAQATSGDTWHLGRNGAPGQSGVVRFVSVGASTEITVQYTY